MKTETGNPPADANSARATLLFVDDEAHVLKSLKRIFLDDPYEILAATSGLEALSLLEGRQVDLVITDYKMPGMNGIEFLREVRDRTPGVIRIMITGHADVKVVQEAVNEGGVYQFIIKPWADEELKATVRRALEHKALIDEKKLIEQENERNRSHLEAIFHSVEDGIITVDNGMQVIEANEAAGKICGLSPKSSGWVNGGAGCSQRCRKVFEEAVVRRRPVHEYIIECEHPQRPRQIIVLNSSPLRDKGGSPLGAVIVIRDITRLTHLERELQERHEFHSLIGKSARMQAIYDLIEKLRDIDTTVLITGKSGTGKEVVASAIHYSGSRAHEPFIVVNCSALSENLLESELFGHVKGAFTGAVNDKKGRFQLAEHGTIFLDEIGDISPKIQLKLLRVLENKTIERVGDATPVKLDVQVLSATNADLREKVSRGEFREDLFYRLKVMEIRLPSLVERREDIPLLVKYFLDVYRKKFRKEITAVSPRVERLFMSYGWPGNIRELVHILEHAFVVCQGRTIDLDDLPPEIREQAAAAVKTGKGPGLEGPGRDMIVGALRKAGWNKAKAAKLLGVSRPTIYRRMLELGISLKDELPEDR